MATTTGDDNAWFSVGPVSSFPNLTESGTSVLCEPHSCDDATTAPGCKVFQVDGRQVEHISNISNGNELRQQVLVFRYKGKIHAIDNNCPHSSYPLSNGTPYDIEDFGIVLSAGITCPKHGWSFDLFTGTADRSNYELRRWEVQLRPQTMGVESEDQEVWVRRKQQ
ncbi:hypothetical protein GGS20DRAFT_585233 [Poronia punctata]|nr:hypothetical protein GGS20DRAFT_585233 [Poronia punctata]